MIDLLVRVVGSLGTVVTALSVVFSMSSPLLIKIVLWLLVAIAAYTVVIDVKSFSAKRPKRFIPNSEKVNGYMCKWLNSGGRVAVFSRDLSWAQKNSKAEEILQNKAKNGELVLFVKVQTALTDQLKSLGAQVNQYPESFVPKARFTVVDYEKDGARLAIGLVEDNMHTIREYDTRHPNVMALANDLISLAQYQKARKKSIK
jgi:hypothetical protein